MAIEKQVLDVDLVIGGVLVAGAIHPSHRYKQTLTDDPHLLAELNVLEGKETREEVAKNLNYDHPNAIDLMAADP